MIWVADLNSVAGDFRVFALHMHAPGSVEDLGVEISGDFAGDDVVAAILYFCPASEKYNVPFSSDVARLQDVELPILISGRVWKRKWPLSSGRIRKSRRFRRFGLVRCERILGRSCRIGR